MKCKKTKIKISAYVDGELQEKEKQQLMLHISKCADCRKELENIQHLASIVNIYEEIQPSAGFMDGMRNKVEKWENRKTALFPFYLLKPAAVGLSIILITFISSLIGNYFGKIMWGKNVNEELSIDKEVKSTLGLNVIDDIQSESFSSVYDKS